MDVMAKNQLSEWYDDPKGDAQQPLPKHTPVTCSEVEDENLQKYRQSLEANGLFTRHTVYRVLE